MVYKEKRFKLIVLVATLVLFGAGVCFYLSIREKPVQNKKTGEIDNKPPEDMILIPAGEFVVGSSENEINEFFKLCKKDEGDACKIEDYQAEYPSQTVYLDDFYIDRKEVSNSDYDKFIAVSGRTPSPYKSDENLNKADEPVVGVTWDDASEYCKWLGKRLPTEAEWEKAARGPNGLVWGWGNEWDGSKLNHGKGGEPGNDPSDNYEYLAPVDKELGVSPYGVLNMFGNVAEWVEDDFAPYFENDRFTHTNYDEGFKVFRGGSYLFTAADLRAATRFADDPFTQSSVIGFRCAK
jgi:formylglycine-generating enzyme required for sulfatase activity